MKILHLWLSDSPQIGGGGAGSMFRIHTNMRKAGYDSKILCETKKSNDPFVLTKPPLSRGESLVRKVTSNLGLNDIHRFSSFKLHEHEEFQKADIVNFHGLLGGFVNYLALPTLTANKPTVLTLRSMWCLTGHCGFSLDCHRWKTGCGQCPYPAAHPPIKRDATRIDWKLKKWAFQRSNLTLVALSEWLTEQVGQSHLSHLPIRTLPNGVDSEEYQPLDQDACRESLGIKDEKYVLMFMAVSLKDFRKGGDLLINALKKLPLEIKKETVLLLLGNNSQDIEEETEIETVNLGYVSHHRLKTIAYSAADIFLMPTRAESFGQVILESMACGTPVAGFNLGPIPELVKPNHNGCLAEPENSTSLASEICRLLKDSKLRAQMRKNCREFALANYSTGKEVENYIGLYQEVLNT